MEEVRREGGREGGRKEGRREGGREGEKEGKARAVNTLHLIKPGIIFPFATL